MHARRLAWLFCAVLVAVTGDAVPVSAQLQLSPLVGDGMVIQRGARVPIRGTAAPGTEVRVSFDGGEWTSRAGEDGRWAVRLPPRGAGGPYELVINAAGERRVITDVMVGDVWVASGQSNMEWPVADAMNGAREVASADDPGIRHIRVPRSWSYRPEPELAGGTWEVSDPEHVGAHSAVAYFFARELRHHVDVPIGIINNSWGGARIEPFMSAGALGLGAEEVASIQRQEEATRERRLEALRERIGSLPATDRGTVDGRPLWAERDLDESAWHSVPVPGLWESAGYDGLDGIGWYRRTFELTEAEAAAPLQLGVGMIDDSDITWVNGHEVGRTVNAWNRARTYTVPATVLRSGANVVAVRVEDTGGGGGINGTRDLLYIETSTGRRSLAGEWRFRVGAVSQDVESEKNQVPTILYNQMVHPLVDYPIKGVIWYQGESNAYPEAAYEYRDQFRAMIRDWREAWGQDELPFLWVQLANFMEPADGTGPSDWAMLRESQGEALSLPGTAQVVAIDLGVADDIHPRNKQAVGARLARAARAVAYGQDVVYSGPVYRSHAIEGDAVRITFDHVGSGLVARDGDPGGFAVAGADGRFVRADARIEGDEVVVWSDAVPDPVAVRYAWADNPIGANLYNAEGLPAAPFRTDRRDPP